MPVIAALMWAAVALNVGLMLTRLASAVSFDTPLLTVTSGAEEESAFALWKYVHGLPVFADPFRMPFAASYYNWLFYAAYGGILRPVLSGLALSDAWLPTIARFISFAFALAGVATGYFCFREQAHTHGRDCYAAPLAWAIFIFLGPLVGFWAVSLNPELPATVCAAGGVLALLRLYPRQAAVATVLATLLSYAAWSFKQSHVFLAVTLCAFLVLRTDWRNLAVVVALHAVLLGLTLMIGSEDYRHLVLLRDTAMTFSAWQFQRNLMNMGVKLLPITASLLFLFFLLGREIVQAPRAWAKDPANNKLAIAVMGVLITAAITLPASAKYGAAENYYFVLSFFMVLAVCARQPVEYLGEGWSIGPIITTTAWLSAGLATILVFLGIAGVTSVYPRHILHSQQRDCLRGLPGPMYSVNPFLALPWVAGHQEGFVVAYDYPTFRQTGRPFERGGIGGLVSEGYFATLALWPAQTMVDGAMLARYTPVTPDCAGLAIYGRLP